MNTLEQLQNCAEKMQKLNPLDCCIMIANKDGVITKFVPAKTFDMKVREGDHIAQGGSLDECIITRKEIHRTLTKELYGVVVKAISIPVEENGEVIGGIAIGISFANQQTLHEAAQTIAATSEQMTATSEDLAATAAQLAQEMDDIRNRGSRVLSEIKKTNEILKFVSDVAANSNLLGINAAIEAARAGEHGRGFSVVADEIRKMAIHSGEAVKNIRSILGNIQEETNTVVATIAATAQLSERQAAATEEISASMQQLAASAQEVEQVAKIV